MTGARGVRVGGYQYYRYLPLEFRAWVPVPVNDRDCWLWTGHHLHRRSGKPLCTHSGWRGVLVATWSYVLHFGPVPLGKKVFVTCLEPRCVNPNHMKLIPRT